MVSPDVGGVVRARAIAKRLDADLAIIDKRRPRANVATVMNIIGDVEGKCCVLVDDMVDTAGTLCSAAGALKKEGAKRVVAYCVHPVLSGPAVDNITKSEMDELVVTDTIPLSEAAQRSDKIRQLSIAQMLAETIRRMAHGRVGQFHVRGLTCNRLRPGFSGYNNRLCFYWRLAWSRVRHCGLSAATFPSRRDE